MGRWWTVLGFGVVAAACAPNLLPNGGFELAEPNGALEGWVTHLPPGGEALADPTVHHSGAAAARLTIPPAAALDWY